ncbi:IS3 family transposase, partial [Dietzia cinnamea]
MKVEFIDRHKDEHGVQPICDALAETSAAIAPSSYYAAKTRPPSARSVRDAELTSAITAMYEENYHVYGVRKMWKEMGRAGHRVARCTVERLMRAEGLKGVQRAKSPRTTRPKAETERPADLVERKFFAERPNQLWVADIT